MIRYLLITALFFSYSLFGYKELRTQGDYIFELYEPNDRIPLTTLCEGLQMYYQAYLEPKLHAGIPLSELKIDETRFHSYEEFIEDMFYRDFLRYPTTQKERRYYFQVRYIPTNQIAGLCVMLKEDEPGCYYMDHIGIHKEFRGQGLASTMIEVVKQELAGFCSISLDTRIFNTPAQALYAKSNFTKLATHPIPRKQTIYFRYVYNEQANRSTPPSTPSQ